MAFHESLDDDAMMSEINMTPLVDVMLVLLIIFILAMPVVTQSIEVELPNVTQQNDKPTKTESVEISVTEDGKIYWNENIVNQEELRLHAHNLAATSPNTVISLRGHRIVEYQHIVSVMAIVREAGLTKLAFVTQFVDDK